VIKTDDFIDYGSDNEKDGYTNGNEAISISGSILILFIKTDYETLNSIISYILLLQSSLIYKLNESKSLRLKDDDVNNDNI
jgi:hypothetical protein